MGWITLLCIFAAGGWVAPLAAADQGFRLVDGDSGKPVQGVTVRLIHAGSSREWELETDEAGRARLAGVTTAQYRLQVEKPGYVDPGDIEGKGRWITVNENAGRELLILLERSVVIAGQVSTEDGHPLSGMGVFAARVLKADGRTRLQRIGALAFSDDQGRYRLHHLPAGSYVIVASPMGDVASGRGLGLVYYPGHRDVARAEVLELMPGTELPSADIRLQPGQQSSVTGTVTGISRDWAGARATVALVPQSGMRLPVALGMTDSTGRYELDGVPEGDYQVLAWGPSANLNFDEPPQGPSARYGSSAVAVRAGETPAVDLALLPGLRVEVQWPTGEACAGVESLRMRLERGWPEWWVFEGHSAGGGIFWDGVPAGTYHFDMPALESSCRFAGVRATPARPPAQRVSIESASVLASVTAASSGAISGTLQSNGAPAPGAVILLSMETGRAFSFETRTDGVGRFRLERLPPGAYRITGLPEVGTEADPATSVPGPAQRRLILASGQELAVELDATPGN